MDFVLCYRGPLLSNGGPRDKHRIRAGVHPQLQTLCAQTPQLHEAQSDTLAEGVLRGSEVEIPRPLQALFFVVRLGGFRFVPIIHRPHELACSLDVIFLRREKPGSIVHGGDLDNRLKTLFDALRMPHDPSELSGVTPSTADQRMYCLLQDDSLITRVSVATHQLLEPSASGEDAADVDLVMHVVVQSTYPMWGNLSF
jgi:hypothetical protein